MAAAAAAPPPQGVPQTAAAAVEDKKSPRALDPVVDPDLLDAIKRAGRFISSDIHQRVARQALTYFSVPQGDWAEYLKKPKAKLDFNTWLNQWKSDPKDTKPLHQFVESRCFGRKELIDSQKMSMNKIVNYIYCKTKKEFELACGGRWQKFLEAKPAAEKVKDYIHSQIGDCVKKHKKSADEVNLVPWDVRARAKAIDDRDEKKTGQARIGGAKSAATATAGAVTLTADGLAKLSRIAIDSTANDLQKKKPAPPAPPKHLQDRKPRLEAVEQEKKNSAEGFAKVAQMSPKPKAADRSSGAAAPTAAMAEPASPAGKTKPVSSAIELLSVGEKSPEMLSSTKKKRGVEDEENEEAKKRRIEQELDVDYDDL
eukprot:CAMPEP_0178988114 /NCGR_PEP_ID=MMETSP0795-20121207/3635_1 /TAXON_ID=88552 /ORGANISM="Amoebophrya sp., Strain Ameob2" /LENGTH=369 /DNA_ID=CAMNT_0020679361 /DNA_START=338 /DNA_END=1447 /DNA_ORIENTATION=+